MKQTISVTLMLEEVNALKFNMERMLRDSEFWLPAEVTRPNKDGELSMLMKPRKNQLKVSIKTGDSTSIDHSTSGQDFP